MTRTWSLRETAVWRRAEAAMRKRWLEGAMIVLTGSLLFGYIPSAANWGAVVYAGSEQSALTTAGQIQSKLTSAAKARLSTTTFTYKGQTSKLRSLLSKAITGALESDVYTKYITDSYSFSWRGTSASAVVTVRFVYRESAAQTKEVDSRVKQIVKSVIKPGMNDHQKVKALHDWIVLHLKYDTTLRKYTAYEGLKTGEAVCQGYSLLAYKLLLEAKVPNLIVEGTAGGQLHAWNLLKLQGQWYHMDTTWDDPTPDKAGQVHYNYYLRTDKQMKRDHSWTRSYPGAGTDYKDTLQSLWKSASGASKAAYESLQEDLGYSLYQTGAAVNTAEGLKAKVLEAIKQGKNTATLRYSGTEEQLTRDLTQLYDLDIRHITYYNEPLEGTSDLKVRVNWED
ncbi:transglutaminase domain-containing protein [Paenibacillus sp. YPG26]|uniref:transglutaminase domain-containing protein n=1 Tax=Paenibacillus sp. YPG26 TaxID=2878915 RepID=UPI002041BA3E|nr:transglutaminase domain-containing protein [Paenibacillus sp. YPG26]USB32637.1 transglutaminase [Paenibacillus sp. YPG26]